MTRRARVGVVSVGLSVEMEFIAHGADDYLVRAL